MSYDTQGVRDVVLAASQAPDQPPEGIRETYLSVPSGVEPDVYALVTRITQDAQNDFDRAAALCAYLRSAYSYTLDQNIPPTDRDFVSWFLLTERQGYCTSFASAMAVMRALRDCLPDISKAMPPFRTATAQPASHSEMRTHGLKSTSAALAG